MWWRSGVGDRPHGPVSRLQIGAILNAIEQRSRLQAGSQFGLERGKPASVTCQVQGHGLIGAKGSGHQLGKVKSMEHAGRHPPRETPALKRQHRQAHAQRVARRGMGVIRRRIEKQIGQPMTAEMNIVGCNRCKDDPHGIDIGRRREPAQVVYDRIRREP